jgi:hypothetical protein
MNSSTAQQNNLNGGFGAMNMTGGPIGQQPGMMAGPHHGNSGSQGQVPGPPSKFGWPYWIPAEGISRQVINEQVSKWLGHDALVKPRMGTGEHDVSWILGIDN